MKNILLLTCLLVVGVSCSHVNRSNSKTKEELIEQWLIASNARAQFDEKTKAAWSLTDPEMPDELKEIVLTHYTWEKYKKLITTVFDECYTKEDILTLIELNKNPKFQDIQKKSVEFAVISHRCQKQMLDEIRPKVIEAVDRLRETKK